jgi:hypothetical protein
MRIMHLSVRTGFDKYKVGKIQCQLLQIYQGATCSALNATQSWTYRYANSLPTTVYRTKIFQPMHMYNKYVQSKKGPMHLPYSQILYRVNNQVLISPRIFVKIPIGLNRILKGQGEMVLYNKSLQSELSCYSPLIFRRAFLLVKYLFTRHLLECGLCGQFFSTVSRKS